MSDALYDYLLTVSVQEEPLLRELRTETQSMPSAQMQISPEQGQFMRLLVELLGVRRALEIGVFTGYSSLCVAGAMAAEGELVACDVSEEYTQVARRYWARAGLADRIQLRLGPALDSLDAMLAAGDAESFDFAFVDADKSNYLAYYERCLRLVRKGGLICIDNVLWGGAVADPAADGASTLAIRELNQRLSADERVSISLVPIGDGLFLARKR